MSRWWAESLRVALAPGEAALLRGGKQLVLTTPDRSAAGLLPLLDATLADTAWRGSRVDVVLSQHFVRHVLTSPPRKAISQAEERALVAAALRNIYGDEASAWQIEVHSQPPQYGLLGAAVNADFTQQLDALLARHGFRDVTIRPLASAAAKRLPAKLDGWWALIETGWLSLFNAHRGIWQSVAAQPIDGEWRMQLSELIARECVGDALPTVWVQGFGVGTLATPESEDARWQILPHDNSVRGALALVAA